MAFVWLTEFNEVQAMIHILTAAARIASIGID
jgi:hypothetical protein